MRFTPALAAVVLLTAGCLATDPATTPPPADGMDPTSLVLRVGETVVHSGGFKGGVSYFHNAGATDLKVTFPEGVLVFDAERRLAPAGAEPVAVAANALVEYLPPYGATNLTVTLESAGVTSEVAVPYAAGAELYSGDLAVELLKVQRDNFPHRDDGNPSFDASIDYFEAFFQDLGYEVVVDRYSQLPALPGVTPTSFNAVVAYKRGTLSPERYLMYGGHFDVVPNTRDGAFDNTGGTVATMVMAKAFQNVTTEHTMVFALWAGEEDGILGSQGWVTKNPQLVPFIDGYYNFDVTPLAYPAPKVEPSPLVVSTGPDGPIADALHEQATIIETTYLALPDAQFVHEAVGQGQAGGAGVNAQSDHTPFMARGIPVFFAFTNRVNDVFAIIHSEVDTVDNLTKYSLTGVEGMANDAPLSPEEVAEGEWYLARSFETNMAIGFYWAVLTDAGVFQAPGRAPAPLVVGELPV